MIVSGLARPALEFEEPIDSLTTRNRKACTRFEPLRSCFSSTPPLSRSPSRSRLLARTRRSSSRSALGPPRARSSRPLSRPASASISGTRSRPRCECSRSPRGRSISVGHSGRALAPEHHARADVDRESPRPVSHGEMCIAAHHERSPGAGPVSPLRARASAARGRGTGGRSEFASPRSRPPCRREARRARFAPARSPRGSRASARRVQISARS